MILEKICYLILGVIPGHDNEGQRFQFVVGCIQRVGFQEQKHLGWQPVPLTCCRPGRHDGGRRERDRRLPRLGKRCKGAGRSRPYAIQSRGRKVEPNLSLSYTSSGLISLTFSSRDWDCPREGNNPTSVSGSPARTLPKPRSPILRVFCPTTLRIRFTIRSLGCNRVILSRFRIPFQTSGY